MKGFPVTETGGPVEVAYNLVREILRSPSVRVTLIVQTDSEEEAIRSAFGETDRLSVIRLEYFSSRRDLETVPRILRAMRGVDLVHFNEFPLRHLGYVLYAKLRGLPTVLSVHGVFSHEVSAFMGPQYPIRILGASGHAEIRAPRFLVALLVRLYRWLAPRWSAVIVNSIANMERAVELEKFPAARVRIIPNGIALATTAPPPPLPHKGPPRLLFVGKLEDVKGPDLLLSALDLLRREGYSVDLTIVGGGSMEPSLRRRAEGMDGHRITFQGYLPHDAVGSFYEWADIVVVPSRYEAFSIVVLEAMSAARPIVATAMGGIPEIVSSPTNAILVAPTPESIAGGIRQLVDRPDLRAGMAKANLAKVRSYAWSEIAPKYVSLYRELVQ